MKDSELKIILEAILLQLEKIALGLAPDQEQIKLAREMLNG